MNKNLDRNSSFELLRIVCMLLIIAGHICKEHHEIYSLENTDYLINRFSKSFISNAVNTFILISGYFGIKFKLQRLIKLDLQTIFYSVTLLIVTLLIGWHELNPIKDFLLFIPIFSKHYWFITVYFVLYLISPILNRFVEKISQDSYKSILILGLILIYVWPTFSFLFNSDQFINDGGYGIINFVYLYLLGRYIKLYYVDNRSAGFYFTMYGITSISLFACQILLTYVLGFDFSSFFCYNTIFILFSAIFLFLGFKNLHFKSKAINLIAAPCLSVYLIHEHKYVWSNICSTIGIEHFHGINYILLLLIFPFIVYSVCFIIDFVRRIIFDKIENLITTKVEKSKIGQYITLLIQNSANNYK